MLHMPPVPVMSLEDRVVGWVLDIQMTVDRLKLPHPHISSKILLHACFGTAGTSFF